MRVKSSLNLTLNEEDSFRNETIKINIRRGRMYSKYIIFAEIILSLTDIILNYSKYTNDFKFNNYLLMYLLMIGINTLYLFSLKNSRECLRNLKLMELINPNDVNRIREEHWIIDIELFCKNFNIKLPKNYE